MTNPLDGRHPEEVYADELERKQRDLDGTARTRPPSLKGTLSRETCPDCGNRLWVFTRVETSVVICGHCDIPAQS